ncbi:MAG: hypothetical protein HFJ60_02765 [Clostridia bacterium]|nr:hypothetical protein [Clostridia bacterium]
MRDGNTYGYYWQSQHYSGGFEKPIDNGKSYWLSGPQKPGTYTKGRVYNIETGRACYSWKDYTESCGFRPVIKLNSKIVLETKDNGETYQIQ